MSKPLTITMISNAMSHHQIPFCEYMNEQNDVEFKFIATKEIAKERLDMGYEDLNYAGEYIIRSYESEACLNYAKQIANESDFVIYGSAPYMFIKNRVKKGKWTFIYSERIFKNGLKDRNLLKKIVAYFLHFSLVPHNKLCLLCASGYAAKDFKKFGLLENRMYKWGYFPPDTNTSKADLLGSKSEGSLIWVGRMIDCKHPELAILLAEKMRDSGVDFNLTMIGNGEMMKELEKMVADKKLKSQITFTGALPKEDVRLHMEKADILLALSNYGEGWGAVINEAMNSGCAVVASRAMGATPFLIHDGVNGVSFESENLEELCVKTLKLIGDKEFRYKLQNNAFDTIKCEWNGRNAGEKLIRLCKELYSGNKDFAYEEGILSIAETDVKF